MEGRATRIGLGVWAALVVLFLWVPLALIMVYAFNKSNVQSWPIPGFTTKWFRVAWGSQEVRDAVWLSVRAGLFATAIAIVLGSAAATAIGRFQFFGREWSRSSNWKRAIAVAAAEPRTIAIAVANRPARTDSQTASRTSCECQATRNHFVVKPGIGQLCTFDLLNA